MRVAVLLLAVGGVSAAGLGWHWHGQIAAAEQRWRSLTQERAALWALAPVPSDANEQALRRELAATEQWIATRRAGVAAAAGAELEAPENYFDLATRIAGWRQQAQQAHVELRATERFGFSSYAEAAPAPAVARAVRRQCRQLEPVLAALFAASPSRLHGVQRQNPRVGPEGGTMTEATEAPEDFFASGRSRDAAVRAGPVAVAGEEFRFEFTGSTQTLRSFLKALAGQKPVAVVREVSVAPEAGVETVGTSLPQASRFTVVVECLREENGSVGGEKS